MENLFIDPTLLLIIAAFAGFFMAFGIGANDVANAMGTSVGSKAITFKQAILIAAVFEFLGAYLAEARLLQLLEKVLLILICMLVKKVFYYRYAVSTMCCRCTALIASTKGWPVSTTHSIVGSIVGFVIISMGFMKPYRGIKLEP